jgi:PTH1 family peptidyl-tRNA hydrolase
MFIIVGLGNPGKRYERTRHNVGFMTVDELAQRHSIAVNRLKWKALWGEGRIGEEKVLLLKPQTFMNLSGDAVVEFVRFYQLPLERLIVLVDDVDIAFGTIRIKAKGSAGSHNGMKSLIQRLGSENFPRIKLAIGNKPSYMDLADYVLGRFTESEEKTVQREIEEAANAAETILRNGIQEAMNAFNNKSF